MEICNIITPYVKENGISYIIYEYSVLFEYRELIDSYDNNWNEISKHQFLEHYFMEIYKDKLNWNFVSFFQFLHIDFIREFKDKFENSWDFLSRRQPIIAEDIVFIRDFQDKINWDELTVSNRLSIDIIREFHNKVNWHSIFNDYDLNIEFLYEFEHEINWIDFTNNLGWNCKFDLIRKFKDKINWDIIFQEHKLYLGEFLCEFNHKLN